MPDFDCKSQNNLVLAKKREGGRADRPTNRKTPGRRARLTNPYIYSIETRLYKKRPKLDRVVQALPDRWIWLEDSQTREITKLPTEDRALQSKKLTSSIGGSSNEF